VSERARLTAELERALDLDEVGIASARFDDYRLKTTHQPIFRHDNDVLTPFGVEARLVAEKPDEVATAPIDFFDALPAERRSFAEALCRRLHVENVRNIGVFEPSDFDTYLTIDPRPETEGGAIAEVASLIRLLNEQGVDPLTVICEIGDAGGRDIKALVALAAELRGAGIRVAIAELRVGQPEIDRVAAVDPDIIKIDGNWFRSMHDTAETAKLLPAVVSAFSSLGPARIFVQGIETPAELEAALRAHADYVQGIALAPPALAGVVFDPNPRSIEALLAPLGKVVPFGRSHQRR